MTNEPSGRTIWDFVFIVSRGLSSVVVPTVVILGSIVGYYLSKERPSPEIRLDVSRIETSNIDTLATIKSIDTRLSTLEQSIRDLPKGELANLETAQLNQSLQTLKQKVDQLGNVILESPEKALAIPLIRKELEELNDKQIALAASFEGQIDRIYDFSKWFFGLMITLAIGLVTMGFVRRPRAPNQ